MTGMKVGELTKRTGLTVRTLHHYDEIGLLAPAERTSSGHRLYGETELRRLQEIVSLKSVGLPLREIKEYLLRNEASLDRVLELQVERINQQIAGRKRLLVLIQGLRQRLRSPNGVTLEELTRTIEVTMKYEKYYTPEQLEQLEEHAGEVGEERIQAVQQEWTELFAAYQVSMERGVNPRVMRYRLWHASRQLSSRNSLGAMKPSQHRWGICTRQRGATVFRPATA